MDSDPMWAALQEAYGGITSKDGGPYGAVVVRNGCIVGRGHSAVRKKNDPTSHGEIEAIRDACSRLGTHDLSNCSLYTTAEPCPMCLCAAILANIQEIRYGCTRDDTARIGGRGKSLYNFLSEKTDIIRLVEHGREQCLALFDEYVSGLRHG